MIASFLTATATSATGACCAGQEVVFNNPPQLQSRVEGYSSPICRDLHLQDTGPDTSFPVREEAPPSNPQVLSELAFPSPCPFLPARTTSSSPFPFNPEPSCRRASSSLPSPSSLSSHPCSLAPRTPTHSRVTYLLAAATQQLHIDTGNSCSCLLLPIPLPLLAAFTPHRGINSAWHQ